jgi:arabinogalactan oligomer/maltooligosaccharide transport system permease protein
MATDAATTGPSTPTGPTGEADRDDRRAPVTRDRMPFGRWFAEFGWRHLVAWLALLFAFFPVAYVVSASFNETGSLASQQLIPRPVSLDNYRTLLNEVPFMQWLWNTILISVSASLATVLLCAMASYAFSRMRFRGRRGGLLFILLAQMFPPLLAFVALFLLVTELGTVSPVLGLDSRLTLFLIYLGTALSVNTWLMKGFFDTLPTDMDEAAEIDGASHVQVFFRILLPLTKPILAVIFLLTVIATNTDFILSSIVLRSEENYTLAVGLTRFISEQYGARWGPFAAGAIMGSVWVIGLFVWLQKYLVDNLTSGAVKG